MAQPAPVSRPPPGAFDDPGSDTDDDVDHAEELVLIQKIDRQCAVLQSKVRTRVRVLVPQYSTTALRVSGSSL
jgi:hypothetical protein